MFTATTADIAAETASNNQVMLALIAVVASAVAALVLVIRNGANIKTARDDAAVAATQATAANQAVNNVGAGKHKMYDMVERIDKRSEGTAERVADLAGDVKLVKADVKSVKTDVVGLKRDQETFDAHGWETLPPDLGTAVGLTTTIRDLQNNHAQVNGKLDTLLSELREHVMWEMGVKHPAGDDG